MSKRSVIEKRIKLAKAKLEMIKADIIEDEKSLLLLSDKQITVTEAEEEVVVKKRPKITEKQLITRRHWIEDFVDEDNGEVISIERSELLKVNGKWVFPFQYLND